jgi:hypothetical protein
MDEKAYKFSFHRRKFIIILCPNDVCKKKKIEKRLYIVKDEGKANHKLEKF